MKLSMAIKDESANYHYDDIVDFTREMINTIKDEDLIPKVGEYYQMFMKVFHDYGDFESSLKYGRRRCPMPRPSMIREGAFCTGLRNDLEYMEEKVRSTDEQGGRPLE